MSKIDKLRKVVNFLETVILCSLVVYYSGLSKTQNIKISTKAYV